MRTPAIVLLLAWCGAGAGSVCRAAPELHPLWELHGRHNTVYLLGSIHVLRPADYPLAPAVMQAYARARSLVMEIDLEDLDAAQVQADLLGSATLPDGETLPQILGPERYAEATGLAHGVGVELSRFDGFAPWFAAEAISELQLAGLGFDPKSGVEMYFVDRARADGKPVAGLETLQDQIALFQSMTMAAQADYLLASLEEARDLPREAGDMVHAWQHGDTAWFAAELKTEAQRDPAFYRSVLAARNRKWVPQIEKLLEGDADCLVIVGTLHLVGSNSVIDLLKRDGIAATQR